MIVFDIIGLIQQNKIIFRIYVNFFQISLLDYIFKDSIYLLKMTNDLKYLL